MAKDIDDKKRKDMEEDNERGRERLRKSSGWHDAMLKAYPPMATQLVQCNSSLQHTLNLNGDYSFQS